MAASSVTVKFFGSTADLPDPTCPINVSYRSLSKQSTPLLLYSSSKIVGYNVVIDFFLMGTRFEIKKMAVSLWGENMTLTHEGQ